MKNYKFKHKNLSKMTNKKYTKFLKTLSKEDLDILISELAHQIADIDDEQSKYATRWGHNEWWQINNTDPIFKEMQKIQDWKNKLIGNYRYAVMTRDKQD